MAEDGDTVPFYSGAQRGGSNTSTLDIREVVKDFDDEVDFAELVDGEAGKQAALEASRKRQQAWVDRQSDQSVPPKNWKANKKARQSSYNLMRYMDNQAPSL